MTDVDQIGRTDPGLDTEGHGRRPNDNETIESDETEGDEA